MINIWFSCMDILWNSNFACSSNSLPSLLIPACDRWNVLLHTLQTLARATGKSCTNAGKVIVPPWWYTRPTKVGHLCHQGGTITSCGQIRNFMRGNARLRAGRCTTSAERPPRKGIMPQPVIRLRHLPRIASVMTFPRLLQRGCAYFPNDLNILEMQRFFCSILGWT